MHELITPDISRRVSGAPKARRNRTHPENTPVALLYGSSDNSLQHKRDGCGGKQGRFFSLRRRISPWSSSSFVHLVVECRIRLNFELLLHPLLLALSVLKEHPPAGPTKSSLGLKEKKKTILIWLYRQKGGGGPTLIPLP